MNKKMLLCYIAIAIFGTSVMLFNAPMSFASEVHDEDLDPKIRASVVLSASIGYRIDNLDWNIAGNQVNILSELEFDDLEIYQAGLDLKATVNRIYSRASISFGEIVNGECTDSDYLEDNRTELFSRSKSQINDDDVLDITAGFGCQFDLINEKLKIAPLVGVSYHQQNIRMTDGVQLVSIPPDQTLPLGPFSGLNSTYRTEWTSCWLGTDIDFELMAHLALSSSLEYHIADYEAKADWNLRDDLAHPVSFAHNDDAQGFVAKLGMNYSFTEHWGMGLLYCWQQWSASEGDCRFFMATGETSTQRLNEVNWGSQSINLSVSYIF